MQPLTIVAVCYQLSLFSIFLPLYIHWILKWRNYYHHFVIRRRFPKISIVVFIIAVMVQISSITVTIHSTDKEKAPLTSLNSSLTLLQLGLIFYRVHLLYVRYRITQSYCINDEIMLNQPRSHKYHGFVLHIMLILIVIGSIITGMSEYFSALGSPELYLFILILIGAMIVVNMVRANVKDSIGCVQESVLVISITFFMVFLTVVLSKVFKNREQNAMLKCSAEFTLHILIATMVLYIPLRLIGKSDAIADASLSDSESQKPPSQNGKPSSHNKGKLFLRTFLKQHQNYNIFAEYLSRCFALENLLFSERALILYHIILKYKSMDTDTMQTGDDNTPKNQFYELQFDYLSDIYAEMDSMIQNAAAESQDTDMKYKKGILSIVGIIYEQFCCDDSSLQINVPWHTYDVLNGLFRGKTEKEICDEFDSYDKLLWIFDEPLQYTLDICESVYSFRFQSYLKSTVRISKQMRKDMWQNAGL